VTEKVGGLLVCESTARRDDREKLFFFAFSRKLLDWKGFRDLDAFRAFAEGRPGMTIEGRSIDGRAVLRPDVTSCCHVTFVPASLFGSLPQHQKA